LILGEILVAIVGIGGLIIFAGSSFRMGELWALIGIVVVMSLTFAALIGGLQRRLTSWNISTGKS
jgi:ABC-type nitrate/sulfonate/bicarbonate transport system permease component